MAKIVRAFALALLWIGCTAAGAAYSEGVDVFGTVDHFVWQEFSDNGTRVLKESGALLGLGVSYRKEFQEQIILDDSGEIFIGIVNYDGATQDGAPTTSTVDYLGLKLKADAGKKIGITEPVSIEPFAGLGLRAWLRSIRNGTTTAARPLFYLLGKCPSASCAQRREPLAGFKLLSSIAILFGGTELEHAQGNRRRF